MKRTKWLLFASLTLLSITSLLIIYTYEQQKMFVLFQEGLPSLGKGFSNNKECNGIYNCSLLVCKKNKPYYANREQNCNVDIQDFIQRSESKNSYDEYLNLLYISKGLTIIEIISLSTTLPMILCFNTFNHRITLCVLLVYHFIVSLLTTSVTTLSIYLEEIQTNLPSFLVDSILAVKILSTIIISLKFIIFIVNSYLLITKSQENSYKENSEDYFPRSMPRLGE